MADIDNELKELSYLWESKEYVLVKTDATLSVIQKEPCSFLLIEDESLLGAVVTQMLKNGVPVYESIKDVLGNK